ncbi:DNRLRE domain-containing protein [Dyadobacter flavalbus]|uniref:DNRLRE domain-containing protein n=1 Tax=Dyadobacter flavalbus TaxID=2579942 RepID=A0A5M8QSE6_9BACT|nr:malectin domain-containing carbohydrate-binding protein [Dyadobacter flavalbus]KAA6439009.1 DNRLRE domain-containing protein [Dyadobacter flavalbus]
MKTLYLFFSLLVLVGTAMAQCPNRNLVFESQGAVDNFPNRYPGCKALKASLIIRKDQVTSLEALNGITSIAGNLEITDNFGLANLHGLETLTSIKGNLYTYNSGLTNLGGLENLTEIGGSLNLGPAAKLTSLAALQNLRSIGKDIDLYGINVQNLAGLQNITSINGRISMVSLHALTSLQGLHNLTRTGMTFSILGALKLTNLNGLEKLKSIGAALPGSTIYLGSLIIRDTPIKNLASLQNLTYLAEDLVLHNTALPDLQGLNNLSTLLGSLELNSNALLENVDGLEKLDSIGQNLTLIQNASLTNLNGLQNLVSIGKRNEHFVTRFLTIAGNPRLSVCDLKPVCDFQEVQGEDFMMIEGNAPGCSSFNELYDSCRDLPVFSFSADTLFFTVAEGAAPSPQSIQLAISDSGNPGVLLTPSMDSEWLIIPVTDKVGSLSFSVNTAGLAPGSYTAIVTAQAPGYRTAFLNVVLTITPAAQLTTVRINAGGESITADDGRTFSSDQYFGGTDRTYAIPSGEIKYTSNNALYRTERSAAAFSYNIPVVNGDYAVVLHFAEIWFGSPQGRPGGAGKRMFNVDMEGSRKLENYDIYAKANGALAAVEEVFYLTVTDGTLNILFSSGAADLPTVAAIEVVPASEYIRSTLTIPVIADAYVHASFTDENFGTSGELIVKSGEENITRNTYLKFPLTGLIQVSSARIRVYGYNVESTMKVNLSAYAVDNDAWTETGITWNNAPASGTVPLTYTTVNNAAGYRDIDVTEFVQSQVAGDKLVSIMLKNRTFVNKKLVFQSKENTLGQAPELVIVTHRPTDAGSRISQEVRPVSLFSEMENQKSGIYPNPVRKQFILRLSKRHEGAVSLQLINKLGRTYDIAPAEQTKKSDQTEVDISGHTLNPGIYLLKVRSATATEHLKLLIAN